MEGQTAHFGTETENRFQMPKMFQDILEPNGFKGT